MKDSTRPRIASAVLVPVYRGEDTELRLVLIRRTEGGVHGGHLAFPGGKHDPEDASLQDTALREAWEELGLDRYLVEVLTELPTVETMTTDFLIYPFLARITRPSTWNRSEREVAEVVEVKLADLARPEASGDDITQLSTWIAPQRGPFYRVGRYQVWGATYRILHPLLPHLLGGEWKF
jgi:8-oxo-dGTP pyrophosphatase MutT (NUDIX family)